MDIDDLTRWREEIERMSDEPWYDDARHNYGKFVQMSQHVERVLGFGNCKFAPFDLWHQIGCGYTNPETGKHHAAYRPIGDVFDNHAAVQSMIQELQEKTR